MNLASQNAANRTIANAIGDFGVPAGGVFYGGQHAMAITGVRTDAVPGRNLAYDIDGFYISDPWRGYAKAKGLPAKQWGRREHDYITNVPEVGQAKSLWEQIFNKSAGEPGEGAYAQGFGYKFVVEPIGPELPDDGTFDQRRRCRRRRWRRI